MPGNSSFLAVVDDDADVRIALIRLLSSAGYAVESFATGAEFLLSIERHVPDCLILDLHMPGMSGFDVQAALARNPHVHIPVVVVTGHDSTDSRNRARDLGAYGYLPKPVDHEALLAAVEGAMGGVMATPLPMLVMMLMAIGESLVGLVILALPREVSLLLVDATIDARGQIVARMLGVAVLALGITWWMARGDAERRSRASAGFLIYNLGVGALFGWAALGAREPALPWIVCIAHVAAGVTYAAFAPRARKLGEGLQ